MSTKKIRRYPKDRLGRRIRGHRASSGKTIIIGDRDIEILKVLQRYRFLRSTYIWELLPASVRGKSIKRFQDRLTDLFHETNTPHSAAYLDWPTQQRNTYNARYTPSIYALAPAGEELLKERGITEKNVTDLVCHGRMSANREFPHAMMICDTLASIEIGTRADPDARFVAWQEILARAPEKTQQADNPFAIPVTVSHRFTKTGKAQTESFRLIPDGLFGLEYLQPSGKKLYRFFALEAEHRNRVNSQSLKPTSFLKKVLAYRYIEKNGVYKTHLGIPNLLVLTVAPTAARVKTMLETIRNVLGARGSPTFLFNTVSALGHDDPSARPARNLYDAAWSHAGHANFALNKQKD